MSVHQKKDGRWYVSYRDEAGKQHTRVFGRGDQAAAMAHEFDETRPGRRRPEKSVAHTIVHTILNEYHKLHRVQASTRSSNAYRIDRTIAPYLGAIVAEELSPKHLDRYVARRTEDGARLSTIARELRLVKAAFSWAEQQDPPLIAANRIARYRLRHGGDRDVPRPPTVDEVRRILDVADPHLRRAVTLFWHLGIRPGGELTRLRWGDANFTNGEILIHSARKGSAVTRYVPFGEELRRHLLDWLESDKKALTEENQIWQRPIVHYGGKPVVSLKTTWATAKQRAGIERPLRLYDLRHAFATEARRNGADLKSLSEVMGHSRPDTTLREYQHVTTDQHREVITKIPRLTSG